MTELELRCMREALRSARNAAASSLQDFSGEPSMRWALMRVVQKVDQASDVLDSMRTRETAEQYAWRARQTELEGVSDVEN